MLVFFKCHSHKFNKAQEEIVKNHSLRLNWTMPAMPGINEHIDSSLINGHLNKIAEFNGFQSESWIVKKVIWFDLPESEIAVEIYIHQVE